MRFIYLFLVSFPRFSREPNGLLQVGSSNALSFIWLHLVDYGKKSGNLSFYLVSMPLFGYRENSRKTKPKKFAWWSKPRECFHLAGWGGNERDMSILIFYSSFFSSKFFCAYWATTIWDIDLIFGCTEKDYRRRITFWVLFFQRKWKLRILTFGLLEHKFSV